MLAVALEILDEEGASGLKVREIAKRAGLSLSVVNHYFVNKQGLLDACKAFFYSGLGETVAAILVEGKGLSTRAVIELAVRDLWSYARVNVAVLRMLVADVVAEGQLIEPFRSYDERPFFAMITNLFAPKLGLSIEVARVRLQALTVLVSRFAISSEAELESVFGFSGAQAAAAAEEHLVEIARLLLFASSEPATGT